MVCKVDTKMYIDSGRMSLGLVGVVFRVTLHQGVYSRGYRCFEREELPGLWCVGFECWLLCALMSRLVRLSVDV
jgi:hypothetical protein